MWGSVEAFLERMNVPKEILQMRLFQTSFIFSPSCLILYFFFFATLLAFPVLGDVLTSLDKGMTAWLFLSYQMDGFD